MLSRVKIRGPSTPFHGGFSRNHVANLVQCFIGRAGLGKSISQASRPRRKRLFGEGGS